MVSVLTTVSRVNFLIQNDVNQAIYQLLAYICNSLQNDLWVADKTEIKAINDFLKVLLFCSK